MTNRKIAAEIILTAKTHPDEYVRCVVASVAHACRYGCVDNSPFKGPHDLTRGQIVAALARCADVERDARKDSTVPHNMHSRLISAESVLRSLAMDAMVVRGRWAEVSQ